MSQTVTSYKTLTNEVPATEDRSYVEQHQLTQQPQVVVHNMNAEVTTYATGPSFSFKWCDFVMSLFTFFCCNIWLSVFGLVYSANSYVSHGEKLYERSRRQNYLARIFWIMSLITGLIVWIVLIIALATLINNQNQIATTLKGVQSG